MLEGLTGVRLRKEEVDRAERRVREVTGWNDPVEEKTGFVEAHARTTWKTSARENSEGPDPRSGTTPEDVGTSNAPDKTNKVDYQLSTEIERSWRNESSIEKWSCR